MSSCRSKIRAIDRADCITADEITYESSRESGRRVPKSFDSLEDAASYAAHRESPTAVINNAIRARFSCIVLHRRKFVCDLQNRMEMLVSGFVRAKAGEPRDICDYAVHQGELITTLTFQG